MPCRVLTPILLVAAALVAGCGQTSLESTPGAGSLQTGALTAKPDIVSADAQYLVGGSPTEAYTNVARGALSCWFGRDGPLKRSHIFGAEAAPAAKGGAAEIVLHERDATLSDQRGTKALRATFAPVGGTTNVAVAAPKFTSPAREAMLRDIEVWAKGGTGCALREVLPAEPVAQTATPAARTKAKPQR